MQMEIEKITSIIPEAEISQTGETRKSSGRKVTSDS